MECIYIKQDTTVFKAVRLCEILGVTAYIKAENSLAEKTSVFGNYEAGDKK